jgi:hypothetical protein
MRPTPAPDDDSRPQATLSPVIKSGPRPSLPIGSLKNLPTPVSTFDHKAVAQALGACGPLMRQLLEASDRCSHGCSTRRFLPRVHQDWTATARTSEGLSALPRGNAGPRQGIRHVVPLYSPRESAIWSRRDTWAPSPLWVKSGSAGIIDPEERSFLQATVP